MEIQGSKKGHPPSRQLQSRTADNRKLSEGDHLSLKPATCGIREQLAVGRSLVIRATCRYKWESLDDLRGEAYGKAISVAEGMWEKTSRWNRQHFFSYFVLVRFGVSIVQKLGTSCISEVSGHLDGNAHLDATSVALVSTSSRGS